MIDPGVVHEAERGLIAGLMMFNGEYMDAVRGLLTAADFHAPKHGHIAHAIFRLADRGETIDPVTVGDELGGLLDDAGGLLYLNDLLINAPTSSPTALVRIISEESYRRRMIHAASRLTDAVAHGGDVAREAVARFIAEAGTITTTTTVAPITFRQLTLPLAIPAIAWHARGLLCSATHGELAGGEKTLKSYLGTIIDVGLAAGLPILGRFAVDRPQKVSSMIGEGGEQGHLRRLIRICAAYGTTPDAIVDNYRYEVATAAANSSRFTTAVRAHLDTFGPDLFHLDPWYAYAPAGVDAKNLYEQGAALSQVGALVTDTGASLLINNHFNQTGNGAGLQRISMAGHAEWCDSWMLVSHRKPPDVAAGRFRLKLIVGSRQWGGAEYHVDFNLGRWDDELNDHVGALHWNITVATDDDAPDPLEAKTADYEARLISTWRRRRGAKTPWTQAEWFDRTTGANTDKRVAWLRLIDLGRIAEVPIGVVDAAGRTQPSGRFVLVESQLETGET